MRLFSIYLYGLSLCLGIFNGFAVLFAVPQLLAFAAVVSSGGAVLSAIAGVLGIFINAFLATAYFMMGLVFLRRESAGTLNVSDALVGWVALLALFGVNLFGTNLITLMFSRF